MNALGKDFIKAEPALEKIADTIPKLVTGFELLATITAKLVGVFERLGWINFPLKLGLMFRGLSLSFGDSATRGRWHRYKPASGHGR
jgi:hypothetical protein